MARQLTLLRWCVVVTLLGLLHAGLPEAQGAEPVKYWAVICGVADYKKIGDLNYTDDDAYDLADALQEYPEWQRQDQIEILIDSAASKGGIHAAIERMGEKAQDGDLCLFFFSGHGMQVVDASGDESDDGSDELDEAICPWDTQFKGRRVTNVITDDDLGDWLANYLPPDADIVAIFDTCYAGGMAEEQEAEGLSVKSVRNPNLPPQAKVRRHFGRGLAQRLAARGAKRADGGAKDIGATKDIGGTNAVVLMACEEGGLSYETSSLKNGIFSFYLVEGLGELAADAPPHGNEDDLLSAEEEFHYASPRTISYATWLEVYQVPVLYDGDTVQETVLVQPGALVAAFTADPTSGPAPLTVTFTDESTGQIDTWSWDFGDGGESTLQNPTHTYASPGTYTVVLTVTGPGEADEATAIVSVTEAAPEVVTITKAEYKSRKRELKVEATSTAGGTADLTVEGYGQMTYDSRKNTYKFQAKGVADPDGWITVTWGLDGSTTHKVTYR